MAAAATSALDGAATGFPPLVAPLDAQHSVSLLDYNSPSHDDPETVGDRTLGDIGISSPTTFEEPLQDRARAHNGKGKGKARASYEEQEQWYHQEVDQSDQEQERPSSEQQQLDEEEQIREEERRIAENLAKWSSTEAQRRAVARRAQTVHVLPPAPPIPSASELVRRSSALIRSGSKRVSRVLGPSSELQDVSVQDIELHEDDPRSKRRCLSQRLNSFDENFGSEDFNPARGTSSPKTVENGGSGYANPFDTPPLSPMTPSSKHPGRIRTTPQRGSRFMEDLPRSATSTGSPLSTAFSHGSQDESQDDKTPRPSIDLPLLERRTRLRFTEEGNEFIDDDPTPRKPRPSRNPFDDDAGTLQPAAPIHPSPRDHSHLDRPYQDEPDSTAYEERIYSSGDHRRFLNFSSSDDHEVDDRFSGRGWDTLERQKRVRAEFGFLDWLMCGCCLGDQADEHDDEQTGRTNPME
ncbi:BZ3500_MvSof-1268-A1-R1_Chr11-1g03317 [Microbotryum saponariae]|uniref:BZ3500_MvSof-1268-A1-R1_Chr11-1g03317 protein n=1 Tax=Microbotryum saponariae TaxID=289078 RepID=A0A2X0LAM5_9BASI|nr:BZ3501_MvSof-1269-A2-R1_Chr11g02893 [Microbotryum saponariae]SDA03951.1 BZ3500_MvSof-1268-A1-R1_Chr11-1g03317 [Microbotryum saponariae]